jgi:hypothetical protein
MTTDRVVTYAPKVTEVERVLRAYDENDALVGEWPITGLGLAELRELFGASDEMYDSYRVEAGQAAALESASGVPLDLARYSYFVDADAL